MIYSRPEGNADSQTMSLKMFPRRWGLFLIVLLALIVSFNMLTGNRKKDKQHREADRLKNNRVFDEPTPIIYAITPTYYRDVQKAELTRLSQTFLHVTNLHWIVIEDSPIKTKLVTNLLSQCGLSYTHLNITTETENRKKRVRRGASQRNLGLSWLRKNLDPVRKPGVVYFADDDNTYDLKIFEQMRKTKKVSVWPVGFAGGLRFEGPVVKNGRVTGWFAHWRPDRRFPLDMAGFAVNLQLFFKYPKLEFSINTTAGFLESTFISDTMVTLDDLEPLADNCTKVLVWHTQTRAPDLSGEVKMKRKVHIGSNPNVEV